MSEASAGAAGREHRLRERFGDGAHGARLHPIAPVDAEIFHAPRFWVLVLLAMAAALLQATLLHGVAIRGGRLSLLTVLIVWTGLRCGVTTGGWLGLIGGIFEDALGGGGVNVLGATLAGFGAGLLSRRFFSDSIPVFAGAVAATTLLRTLANYAVIELAFGERGMFHRMSHEMLWQIVLNVFAAIVVLLVLRAASHAPRSRS